MSDLHTQLLLESIMESQRGARRFIELSVKCDSVTVVVCIEEIHGDGIDVAHLHSWLSKMVNDEVDSIDKIGYDVWCDTLYQHIALVFVHRYTHITITQVNGVGFTSQYNVTKLRK